MSEKMGIAKRCLILGLAYYFLWPYAIISWIDKKRSERVQAGDVFIDEEIKYDLMCFILYFISASVMYIAFVLQIWWLFIVTFSPLLVSSANYLLLKFKKS